MGLSAASKKLLKKLSRPFRANKQLNETAKKRMDEKYPHGWSQSPMMMAEFKETKKRIYKGIGK